MKVLRYSVDSYYPEEGTARVEVCEQTPGLDPLSLWREIHASGRDNFDWWGGGSSFQDVDASTPLLRERRVREGMVFFAMAEGDEVLVVSDGTKQARQAIKKAYGELLEMQVEPHSQ